SSLVIHFQFHEDRNQINEYKSATVTNIAPQWIGLKTDSVVRYLEILFVLDTDMYFHQLNIRGILAGIHQMTGRNITLNQLMNYRNTRLKELPNHDIALLMNYDYHGGVAYVNGICSQNAVGIIGFLPHAPMEYTAVIFHEIAHLLGLTHSSYSNFDCDYKDDYGTYLKIDGFDDKCAAQMLADKLGQHFCLKNLPQKSAPKNYAICGNNFLEFGEECDCGPQRYCNSYICNAKTCMRTISDFQLHSIFFGVLALIIIVFVWGHFGAEKKGQHRICDQNTTKYIKTW
ncbi:unnamed protein product, partial [Thelazia callipaeda]|uniref:Peptidase M12B domain-containing protein n=1 Tax=Thelazia callipaeda TaxID=103827 RepID=A0A158RCJ3_THECL